MYVIRSLPTFPCTYQMESTYTTHVQKQVHAMHVLIHNVGKEMRTHFNSTSTYLMESYQEIYGKWQSASVRTSQMKNGAANMYHA
jgi:hypothetical protein